MKTDEKRVVRLSEIIDLPVYRVADILPILDKSESDENKKNTSTLVEIADSIRENGLLDPITLWVDEETGLTMILDGRNRRLACKIAAETDKIALEDYEVPVVDFTGTLEEAFNYVRAKSTRRDLTKSQRAMVAAKFIHECGPEVELLKARALGNKQAAAAKATAARTGNVDPNVGDNEVTKAVLAETVAEMWGASRGYVEDALRMLRDEDRAREGAARHAEEALRLSQIVDESEKELEEARTEGDSSKVWEIAQKKNAAQFAAEDEREKAAAKAQEASAKAAQIEKIANDQAKIREPKKEPKAESDDPIKQIRTRINSAVSNLKQSITELAKVSGQGEDDYNFVGRKITEVVQSFDNAFGVIEE